MASLACLAGQASNVLDRLGDRRKQSGLTGTSTGRRRLSYWYAWTTSRGWLPARRGDARERLRLNKEIERQHVKQERRGDRVGKPADHPAARKEQGITARGRTKGR
jgi:hypothetical protein